MRNYVKAKSLGGRFGGALFVLLLSISLGACASMKWHKPKISLADVRVTGGNLLESRLVLSLRVRNENDRDITLDGLVFDILAGEFVVAKGIRSTPVVLSRMSDTVVDIDATARTLDLLMRLPALVQSDGRVSYVVKGEAVIRDYGRVPFDHKESFAMPKISGLRMGPAASSSSVAALPGAQDGAQPSTLPSAPATSPQ